MAVKIRLSRIGTTNRPFYRLIAVDSRKKRDGAQLATIGTYDPVNGSVVQFHEELYKEWLSKGAQETDSAKKVYRLYKKSAASSVKSEKVVVESPVAQEEIAS
jgi:small subunit ribosomal protein S16